jgi:putative FmdB family regulatory protein
VPTYVYKCSNGHQYELREGFDAPSRQACTVCGTQAKRVLFPPPIVFKGSGFYITDSRKGTTATIADSATANPATTESSSDNGSSSTESKPAATTASSDD